MYVPKSDQRIEGKRILMILGMIKTRHSPPLIVMLLDIDQYCFPHVAFHNFVVDPDESV